MITLVKIVKKVYIIHGWEGYPENNWFPWLKKELEKRKFKVIIPSMPNTEEPKIEEWVSFLKKQVNQPDKNTYFIGHSIGCQTIMRYLETLRGDVKIGGIIFVAGWFNLINLETKEAELIAKPWLETLINFNKILSHNKKFVVIFSDNDKFVPLTDAKLFKNRLGAKIIIEKNKGHFDDENLVKELPVVLKELLKLA